MKVKRLIFWDVDGTLMYCGRTGTDALNKTFQELYGIEDALAKAPIGGAMDWSILTGILDAFGLPREELSRVKSHYGTSLSRLLEENESKRALPGVRKILTAIEKHGGAVNALLTSNLRIGAEIKLRSVGLDGFFTLGGFGDEPGEKWDAARRGVALAQACYSAAFSTDQIYLVGDGTYDITTAKRLGIKCVAVGSGWVPGEELKKRNPDFYFDDLHRVDEVLKVLLNGIE